MRYIFFLYISLFLLSSLVVSVDGAVTSTWNETNKTLSVYQGKTLLGTVRQVSVNPDLTSFEEILEIKPSVNYIPNQSGGFNLKFFDRYGNLSDKIDSFSWYNWTNVSYNISVPDYAYVFYEEPNCSIESLSANFINVTVEDYILRYNNYTAYKNGSVPMDGWNHTFIYDNFNATWWNGSRYSVVGEHQEIRYKMDWIKIDPLNTTFLAGSAYTVKLVLTKKAVIGSESIKVVPNFFGVDEERLTWWNSSWTKKRALQINNSLGSAQTNYQVYVNISYDSDMQTDFDDIRVVNESASGVPYWIENKTDSQWCQIWFNATSLPASSWLNDTYYIYYGNSSVATTSMGNNTFMFFDNYDSDSGDWTTSGGTWSVTGGETKLTSGAYTDSYKTKNLGVSKNIAFRTKLKYVTNVGQWYGLIFRYQDSSNQWRMVLNVPATNKFIIWKTIAGGTTEWSYSYTPISNVYNIIEVTIDQNDNIRGVLDNIERISISSDTNLNTQNNGGMRAGTGSAQTNDIRWDWGLVRKYVSPEPGVIVGGEEVNQICGVYVEQLPTGDGATIGTWTPIPASPVTRYDKVDEGANGYSINDYDSVISVTNNGLSDFTFTSFALNSTDTVSNLTAFYRAADVTAGTNTIQSSLIVGNTYYNTTSSTSNPNTAWATYNYPWYTNPKTTVNWTVNDINGTNSNNLQSFGVFTPDANPDVNISAVWIRVYYCYMPEEGVAGNVYWKNATDTLTISDSTNKLSVKKPKDTLTTSDSVKKGWNLTKTTLDTATIGDKSRILVTHSGIDVLGISDKVRILAVKPLLNSLTISDNVLRRTPLIIKGITDAIVISDAKMLMLIKPLSDVLSMVDGVSKTLVFNRGILDALNVVDFKQVFVVKPLNDILNIGDIKGVLGIKPISNSLSIVDIVNRVLVYNRGSTDSLAISDFRQMLLVKPLSDSLGIVDFVVKRTPYISKSIFDSIAIGDKARLLAIKPYSDVLSILDSKKVLGIKGLLDAISIGDFKQLLAIKPKSDGLTIVDSSRVLLSKPLIDTLSIVDVKQLLAFKPKMDSIATTDYMQLMVVKPISNSLTIIDSTRLMAVKPLIDSISLLDFSSRNTPYIKKSIIDVLVIVDVKNVLAIKPLTDLLNIPDSVFRHTPFIGKSISDILTITDTKLLMAIKPIVNSIFISDALFKQITKPSILDIIDLTDFKQIMVIKPISSSLTIIDNIGLMVIKPLSDSLSLVDFASKGNPFISKSIVDVMAIADIDVLMVIKPLLDSVIMEDFLSRTISIQRTMIDTIAISDFRQNLLTKWFLDSIVITDKGSLLVVKPILEMVNVVDGVFKHIPFASRSILDIVAIDEFIEWFYIPTTFQIHWRNATDTMNINDITRLQITKPMLDVLSKTDFMARQLWLSRGILDILNIEGINRIMITKPLMDSYVIVDILSKAVFLHPTDQLLTTDKINILIVKPTLDILTLIDTKVLLVIKEPLDILVISDIQDRWISLTKMALDSLDIRDGLQVWLSKEAVDTLNMIDDIGKMVIIKPIDILAIGDLQSKWNIITKEILDIVTISDIRLKMPIIRSNDIIGVVDFISGYAMLLIRPVIPANLTIVNVLDTLNIAIDIAVSKITAGLPSVGGGGSGGSGVPMPEIVTIPIPIKEPKRYVTFFNIAVFILIASLLLLVFRYRNGYNDVVDSFKSYVINNKKNRKGEKNE